MCAELLGLHLYAGPFLLAASILVATFFLEDAAIAYAAVLATGGWIAPELAFPILFVGIYVGDLGLYLLGLAGRRFPWVQSILATRSAAHAGEWLEKRAVMALIFARLLPGSRLPVYAASGFLRMPFARFAAVTAGSTLVWTAGIFSAIYHFGMRATLILGEFKYLAAIIAVVTTLAASTLCARFVIQRMSARHA
jgi:membrane protein DedA with SNARE-associated domain